MGLVGFITRINHNSRSPERQIKRLTRHMNSTQNFTHVSFLPNFFFNCRPFLSFFCVRVTHTQVLLYEVAELLLLLLLLLSSLSSYDMDVSCHRPFLLGTSLEPAVIPTAQASSFTLQYFPYYV